VHASGSHAKRSRATLFAVARIGFIGLGRMGRGMATRLLAAGQEVRVFNRTRANAEALAPLGAVVCETPAEAASGAEAIFAMTADDASSRAVWLGSDGV